MHASLAVTGTVCLFSLHMATGLHYASHLCVLCTCTGSAHRFCAFYASLDLAVMHNSHDACAEGLLSCKAPWCQGYSRHQLSKPRLNNHFSFVGKENAQMREWHSNCTPGQQVRWGPAVITCQCALIRAHCKVARLLWLESGTRHSFPFNYELVKVVCTLSSRALLSHHAHSNIIKHSMYPPYWHAGIRVGSAMRAQDCFGGPCALVRARMIANGPPTL